MLTRKIDKEKTWYPTSVDDYETLLSKLIIRGKGYTHVYALRKNLAYNLQYLEFVNQSLEDLKISSVIEKLLWKQFIITGCGIVESLLHYVLISKGYHKTTEWDKDFVITGQQKNINGKQIRIDSTHYTKMSSAKNEQMTFDSMIKRAESKKCLGSDHSVYARLNKLRSLRNRIHLQEIGNPLDTDWNAVEKKDFYIMSSVLKAIFTGGLFRPNAKQKQYFEYLPKTTD